MDAPKRSHCGGRLGFIALITEEEPAKKILESRGLQSAPPPMSRAQAPDYDLLGSLPPDQD